MSCSASQCIECVVITKPDVILHAHSSVKHMSCTCMVFSMLCTHHGDEVLHLQSLVAKAHYKVHKVTELISKVFC